MRVTLAAYQHDQLEKTDSGPVLTSGSKEYNSLAKLKAVTQQPRRPKYLLGRKFNS